MLLSVWDAVCCVIQQGTAQIHGLPHKLAPTRVRLRVSRYDASIRQPLHTGMEAAEKRFLSSAIFVAAHRSYHGVNDSPYFLLPASRGSTCCAWRTPVGQFQARGFYGFTTITITRTHVGNKGFLPLAHQPLDRNCSRLPMDKWRVKGAACLSRPQSILLAV